MSLEVGAPDQALTGKDRQDVVAVDPLRRRLVALQQLLEVEQEPDPGTVPKDRVEGREEDAPSLPRLLEGWGEFMIEGSAIRWRGSGSAHARSTESPDSADQ